MKNKDSKNNTVDTETSELIQKGIAKRLIKFDDDRSYIDYLFENIHRNYKNPEEQVQAETYLKLILVYNYPVKRVKQFVKVTMGSAVKEADIIVYNDDACTQPHIVIECKKQEVSEQEFMQAVNQGFAYAYALAGTIKFSWVTSGIKNVYYEVDKEKDIKSTVPDIPQYGVDKLAKYKYAKGGGTVNGQQLFDLENVTQAELTRRFELAHQALWGGGALNPSTAFDELDKLIFCKIWDEKKARKDGVPYDFQIFTEDTEVNTNIKLRERILDLYEEGRKQDPEVFKDDIKLDSIKIRTVVGYLEGINLSETDLDSKGRAFETFMGSFFRGDFGQYFTPRPIVDFIVSVLPIKNTSLVLDTSCGSGGFLLHALDKVRKQADDFYDSNNPKQATKYYNYWHDFAQSNLYGIEINEQIARTAKMNMIIHDDGHTNVVTADGLWSDYEVALTTGNKGFVYNRFDFIITNPPFGSTIKQTEQAYLHQYKMALKDVDWLNPKSKASTRPAQSTEILFIEQCHHYLKEGGYLAIVIPDGILTNSSMQYVRDNIEDLYRIVAVISLPQTAFNHTGAGVKSSVLFLKKYSNQKTLQIRNLKQKIKDDLKDEQEFLTKYNQIEKDKARDVKALKGFEYDKAIPLLELKKTDRYIEWYNQLSEDYQQKMDKLKEELNELLETRLHKFLSSPEWDYSIFMAIAEDIGYDATGKPTPNNELENISTELSRFMQAIEEGQNS
ncbi:MAG TPA: N-6 DNA methylase [Candidatus Cloacimonadota bacterium]|nr:N-6 DNA methylase [Candidatus Cloacimonadota bacterium]